MKNSTLKKVAIGMAATCVVNVCSGCGSKGREEFYAKTNITEFDEQSITINGLYVGFGKNSLTDEEELFIT